MTRFLVPAVVIGIVCAAVGALLGHRAITPTYTTSTTLKITPSANQSIAQHVELLGSQQVAERAVQDESWLATGPSTSPEMLQRFRQCLNVTNPGGGELVVASFSDESAQATHAGLQPPCTRTSRQSANVSTDFALTDSPTFVILNRSRTTPSDR